MVHETEYVTSRIPVGEFAGRLGSAEATFVPRDHSVRRPQRRDLWIEHGVIHEEPVTQDHGRSGSSGVLEVDVGAVDASCRHERTVVRSGRGPDQDFGTVLAGDETEITDRKEPGPIPGVEVSDVFEVDLSARDENVHVSIVRGGDLLPGS